MKPVKFPGQNVVFGSEQPEYNPLPALRFQDGEVITCWELTDSDLEKISSSKRIYLSQLTFNLPLQPVKLMPDLDEGVEIITSNSDGEI
jgi:hypothetical protein